MERTKGLHLGLATLAALCVGLAACAERRPEADAGWSAPPPGSQDASATEAELDIDDQVSIARQDLAQRLAIDPDAISVEAARHVNWRSGAAGCPAPGMNYTMAIVPGVLVLLRADGEVYRYHGGRSTAPAYCPAERAEAPVYGQGEEAM